MNRAATYGKAYELTMAQAQQRNDTKKSCAATQKRYRKTSAAATAPQQPRRERTKQLAGAANSQFTAS